MADTGRRRVGASAAGASPAGVRSPPRYLPPQQTTQPQRYARPDSGRAGTQGGMNMGMRGPNGAPKTPPVNSKMGIKSGMTVEDLKRLTQQRIQQTSGQDPLTQRPATPTAATSSAMPAASSGSASTPATPTLNMAVVHAHAAGSGGGGGGGGAGGSTNIPTPTPLVPKAGMSVQELKQLTSLRLASQNVPMHQSEITGLVSKAVLSNAAKSHYRESLRSSLTPSTTPKRTMAGGPSTPGRSSIGGGSGGHNVSSPPVYDHMAERHSLPSRPLGIPSMRGNDNDMRNRSSDFGLHSINQMRYSYSGPDDFGSDSSQETDYTRPSLDLEEEGGRYAFDDFNSFAEDSFPPPPPLDDNGGFVSTSLPSWSPPPARSKKLDANPQPVSFYSQQPSFFNQQQSREDTSRDQNAVIAPPPGLTRRPSMTVPWQVAEAVLNTPQTTTVRKTVMSPTSSGDGRPEPVTSNMFARRNEGQGLNRPAAEVAAELSALALSRQRSGAPPPAPNTNTIVTAVLGTSPPGGSAGARRGSFGNAAEFFKFRRRSKSRLELARDIAGMSAGEGGGFPNYGATGGNGAGSSGMPGIDESRDLQDNFSVLAQGDSSSVDDDSPVYTPGDEDFEGSEGGGSFVSFYNATGVGRSREGGVSGLSSLSIPPPPPPPLTDDEDDSSTTSSSKGLPMMSPNGFRLRKVAELARRGSLSSEDKTRVKDEIIQSSLGIGASNAARILTAKPANAAAAPTPGERPPVSVSTTAPPPGFQRLSSTPPRDTPKATATKSLAAGIVRNPTTGIAARSPPKPSTMMSPTSGPGRKTLSPTAAADTRTLEERLSSAAQRVADCAGKGDMVGFQEAMAELDGLRNEANARMMRG